DKPVLEVRIQRRSRRTGSPAGSRSSKPRFRNFDVKSGPSSASSARPVWAKVTVLCGAIGARASSGWLARRTSRTIDKAESTTPAMMPANAARTTSSSDTSAEDLESVGAAELPRLASGDEPAASLPHQLPPIEAHAVDVGAGARLEIHPRVPDRGRPVVGLEAGDRRTDLVRAVTDHLLMPWPPDHR